MEIKVRETLRLKVCKTLRQQSQTMSHSKSAGCLLNDVEKINQKLCEILSKQLQRKSNSKVAECLLHNNSETLK